MHLSSLFDRIYLHTKLILVAGQYKPEWVHLPPHGHRVRIDPSDIRALHMMAWRTIRRKYCRNRDFWERACRLLAPEWAVDVGVNYGECLFLPCYAAQTRVLGVEANPGLRPFLEESLAVHPCAQQIQLIFAAAAAESGQKLPLFVDPLWSGRSTMVQNQSRGRQRARQEIKVETVRIDDLLDNGHMPPESRIVFKIDVEGYERHVLSGMWQALDACGSALGFIEFDPQMLANAGVSAEEFAEELHTRFDVWYFSGKATIVHSNLRNFVKVIREAGQDKHLQTDVVLSKNAPSGLLGQLLSPWRNAKY